MDDYKQQVSEFFNQRTAYDLEGSRHPHEANLLLKSVPLQEGQRVLDVATGTGLIALPAAQKVGLEGYVLGIDISPGMLHQARQKIEALGLKNIEFIQTDADYLDCADESFDVIFCCSAIMYLTNIPTTLQKWYYWLKPNGFVALSCAAETAYMATVQRRVCARLFDIKLPHINEPLGTPQKCHNLLKQAGFKDIDVKVEPSGEYLSLNEREMSWTGSGFYPRGNPLLQLSPEQLARLQSEYRAEVERLVTDKGIWLDTTTFFVRARK